MFLYFVKASERLLASHGIQTNDALFLSNAPAGIIKIRFKENEERGQTYQGAKVCFNFMITLIKIESISVKLVILSS